MLCYNIYEIFPEKWKYPMANAQPLTRAALLRMPKSAYMNAQQRDETQEALERNFAKQRI